MENTPIIEPKSSTQKRLEILNEVKRRASEKGDYTLFSQVSQDIRDLENELKALENNEQGS
jgi:hypothetical protein